MRGGIEETSASFEARYAPRSYPTLTCAPGEAPKPIRAELVLELVLLNLLRLLCACMLVRFVAADHATCGGPDEAVMPGEMTGGAADESALDAPLGIGRRDAGHKRKR